MIKLYLKPIDWVGNPILKRSCHSVLSHEILGPKESNHFGFFLHGILGSKRNWRSPARLWRTLHPEYSCVTIDHRGHGDSKHKKSKTNNLEECAQDILKLINDKHIHYPEIIFAHSFGGKVALQYLFELSKLSKHNQATSTATNNIAFPKHVWILDSIPRKYTLDSDSNKEESVHHVFNVLQQLPLTFTSKEVILEELIRKEITVSTAQWLVSGIIPINDNTTNSTTTTTTGTSNITATTSSSYQPLYTWGFDIHTTTELFHHFCETDMWHNLEIFDGPTTIHFLRAGKNKAWTPSILHDFDSLCQQNKKIKLHTMEHVGHWLHVEDLHGMMSLIDTHSDNIE